MWSNERREVRESLIRSHWLEEERGWNGSSISVYSLCEGNNQFARETIDTPALYPLSQLQPKPHPLSHINIVSHSHRVTVSYPHRGGKTALPVICPDMIRRSRAERSASSWALWRLSCCWPDFEKHWVVSLMRLSCRPGGRWHSRPLRMPHILSVGLAESPCPGLCWECWLK